MLIAICYTFLEVFYCPLWYLLVPFEAFQGNHRGSRSSIPKNEKEIDLNVTEKLTSILQDEVKGRYIHTDWGWKISWSIEFQNKSLASKVTLYLTGKPKTSQNTLNQTTILMWSDRFSIILCLLFIHVQKNTQKVWNWFHVIEVKHLLGKASCPKLNTAERWGWSPSSSPAMPGV